MTTMRDLHRLRPCAACPTRMAVPGSPVCTTCEAETVNALIADLPRQPTPKGSPMTDAPMNAFIAPVGTDPADPSAWIPVGWAESLVLHADADADAEEVTPLALSDLSFIIPVEWDAAAQASFAAWISSTFARAPRRRRPRPQRAARTRQARRYLRREEAAGRFWWHRQSPAAQNRAARTEWWGH